METKDYLNYVVHEIHRTIVATVDDEGLPVTAAIDMMDCDDNSLYFLTAKGKGFYDRLIKRGFLAFTAMKGEMKEITSRTAVSDAEAVWKYVRRVVSDRTVFRFRLSRSIDCTAETV